MLRKIVAGTATQADYEASLLIRTKKPRASRRRKVEN